MGDPVKKPSSEQEVMDVILNRRAEQAYASAADEPSI